MLLYRDLQEVDFNTNSGSISVAYKHLCYTFSSEFINTLYGFAFGWMSALGPWDTFNEERRMTDCAERVNMYS